MANEKREICSKCGVRVARIKGMCKKCYHSEYAKAWYQRTKHPKFEPGADRRSEKSKQIITKYALGMTQTELAKEYGISRQRVSTIIKEAGVSRGKPQKKC